MLHAMDSTQLRENLAKLRLSQASAARDLDISERQLRRYISGEWPIPRVVDFAVMHLLSRLPAPPIASPVTRPAPAQPPVAPPDVALESAAANRKRPGDLSMLQRMAAAKTRS